MLRISSSNNSSSSSKSTSPARLIDDPVVSDVSAISAILSFIVLSSCLMVFGFPETKFEWVSQPVSWLNNANAIDSKTGM
jgi:hypothetical protein